MRLRIIEFLNINFLYNYVKITHKLYSAFNNYYITGISYNIAVFYSFFFWESLLALNRLRKVAHPRLTISTKFNWWATGMNLKLIV